MKNKIFKLLRKSSFFRFIKKNTTKQYVTPRKGLKIIGNYNGSIILQSVGGGNRLIFHGDSILDDTIFRITGNNNTIIIEDRCRIGANCSFWAEGSNITIHIGSLSTFTHSVHFCIQEDNMGVDVGTDCQFSNSIIVRTSDSHIIRDKKTGERTNFGKPVKIGNHVWIAPHSTIMKGVTIGDGSIIGTNSLVTNDVPQYSLAVGMPAKVVKSNIEWERQATFELTKDKIIKAYENQCNKAY